MGIAAQIVDGCGTSRKAKVTPSGELVTGPLSYSGTKFQAMNAADTAFHFYPPIPNSQFVITGLRIKATTGVSPNTDAVIIVYEANSATSTTADKILHQEGLLKGDAATLLPLALLVNQEKFLNAKTNDATVNITIMGYYIQASAGSGVPEDLR